MNYIKSIENYNPINEQEKTDKRLILFYINKFEDILFRENEFAHITSSAFVINTVSYTHLTLPTILRV